MIINTDNIIDGKLLKLMSDTNMLCPLCCTAKVLLYNPSFIMYVFSFVGASSNFEKVETSTIITTQGIGYDFGSVMHYYSHAFSKNGKPTITPKDSSISPNSLGQRNGFSTKDLEHARTLYCDGKAPGSWGSWSSWSSCTKTCNGGTQSRNRTCVGGTGCSGLSYETRQCNKDDCPGMLEFSKNIQLLFTMCII